MMSVGTMAEVIIAISSICSGCIWLWPRIIRWIGKPQIVWGHLDSFSLKGINDRRVLGSHFYILIKSRYWFFKPNYPEKTIKLNLKLHNVKPFDFEVNITDFFTTVGCEHLQEVKTSQKDFDDHKEVEFDLPAYNLFRITIKGSGGTAGSLFHNNMFIDIHANDANIIQKQHKPPYANIILNRHRLNS